MPPTYVEALAEHWPRGVALLNRVERVVETVWPCPELADHYLIELERNTAPVTSGDAP